MKVTGWTYWDNKDYDELPNEMCDEAFKVVAKEVKEKGYKFSGMSHQYSRKGTPIIDNKYRYNVSCRMWGEIMASAYDLYESEDDSYAYVLWAWRPRLFDESGPIFEKEIFPS